MIGSNMPEELIAKLYREDPEIRAIIDNAEPDMPRSAAWSSQPTAMFLRLWPQWDLSQFAARFRFNLQGVQQDMPVRFFQRHNNVPMTLAQHRLWDEVRTEVALANHSEPHRVWVGMTHWPMTTDWDQSHLFLLVGTRQDPWHGAVIGLHFDSVMYPGGWRKDKNTGYRDWGFNSKGIMKWQG